MTQATEKPSSFAPPTGYKQTEVGIIPEDWEVSTVGREFDIKLGKMLDAERNVGTLKPYLGNKSVQWNRIDLGNLQVMAMTQSDLKRFRLRQGDLLVCEGGEVGRAAIWESQIDECYYQKALHRLRPLRKFNVKLFLEFLHYWTDHEMLADYVSQTSIAHLTREKFAQVPLPVPPLPEQQAITAVLSDADALITTLDQLIAKKRNLKQGAMQLLLTGKKSKSWERVSLNDSFTLKARIGWQGLTTDEYLKTGNYHLVTGTDFLNGRVNWETCHFVDRWRFAQDRNIQVKVGDVLVTKDGTIGKVAFVDHLPLPSTLNSGVFVLRPKENRYFSQYLFYILNSTYFEAFLKQLAASSTISHLYQKDFVNFSFPMPPFEEQQAIARVLSGMDAELAALERQRGKYQAVKQGMMQELLTGKTRLV